MNIQHRGRWLVLVVAIAGLAAALYWRLSATEDGKGRSAPTEQAVTVIQAKVADTPVLVEVNGNVVPLKVVDVHSQIGRAHV